MRHLLLVAVVIATKAAGMAQDPDYVVTAVGTDAFIGGQAEADVLLDNSGAPVQGFSFSMESDYLALDPVEFLAGSDLSAMNGGAGPSFLNVAFFHDLFPGGTGVACGTVFSFVGTESLGVGAAYQLFTVVYDVTATQETSTIIEFTDALGSPPVISAVVVNGDSIVPVLVDGALNITSAPSFLRGDASPSGGIDLADPIFVLNYLFQAGPAFCMDAIDANADGIIDLADSLWLLEYLNGFGPMMPPPFPSCGTAPLLGCEIYPLCP